jgi:hypothetical protein
MCRAVVIAPLLPTAPEHTRKLSSRRCGAYTNAASSEYFGHSWSQLGDALSMSFRFRSAANRPRVYQTPCRDEDHRCGSAVGHVVEKASQIGAPGRAKTSEPTQELPEGGTHVNYHPTSRFSGGCVSLLPAAPTGKGCANG